MRHPNRMNNGAPILGTIARKKASRNESVIRRLMSDELNQQRFEQRWRAAGLPKHRSMMLACSPLALGNVPGAEPLTVEMGVVWVRENQNPIVSGFVAVARRADRFRFDDEN